MIKQGFESRVKKINPITTMDSAFGAAATLSANTAIMNLIAEVESNHKRFMNGLRMPNTQ